MKKVRQSINVILSAVIVALGFGSCVSQQKFLAAQEEINQLKERNETLNAENQKLQSHINALNEKIRMEQQKVVYGPRPTVYKEDINQ